MNSVWAIPYLFIVCALFSCGKDGQSVRDLDNLGDTPYQMDSIYVTYGTDPNRALVLLDSAVILGNISEYAEQILRATIYSKSLSRQNQDSALVICETLMESDSVKENLEKREDVIDLLMNIYRVRGDQNEFLQWSLQKADICREKGDEVERLRIEAEIGFTLTHLGRMEEGMAKLDNCIQQLDKPGSVARMDAFIIASKRKINVLNEQELYAEIIPLAQHILDRLDHFEQHQGEYAMDSYRLRFLYTQPNERERYLDFSRAQTNGFMAIAYAIMGEDQKAHHHLALFDQSHYGHSFSARRMIIPAQVALGLFDGAMSTCQQMVDRMGADTINYDYSMILRYRAIDAYSKGQLDEAYGFMNRHAQLTKVLSDSLHRSQAHDFAARYHDTEQQLKIQEVENESRVKSIIAAAIASLLIVTIIALLYFWRERKLIAHKNRVLVRMINVNRWMALEDEATEDAIEDDERAGDAAVEQNMVTDNAEEHPKEDNQEQKIGDMKHNLKINDEMFNYLDYTIREERLYSNPYLQRQDICDRFGISRVTLNNLLSHYRNNASLPQYINSIRLEEAVKLLREYPDMSITAIAENVGFSLANFRIQFIRNLGMTPMEYRKNFKFMELRSKKYYYFAKGTEGK